MNSVASERVSEQASAVERLIKMNSAEQANEWAVQANEQADKQMAQHFTRRSHAISTQSVVRAEWVEFDRRSAKMREEWKQK